MNCFCIYSFKTFMENVEFTYDFLNKIAFRKNGCKFANRAQRH